MTTSQRIRFATAMEEQAALSGDWQTVVEEGCRLLTEKEAISFGLDCVVRVVDSWNSQFNDDTRVVDAIQGVRRWCSGESKAEDFQALSTAASDAAIEADDPNKVPFDVSITRAVHAANAASSIADAARSACEPDAARQLGPDSVPLAVAYAVSFSLNASTAEAEEKDWQRKLLSQTLKAE